MTCTTRRELVLRRSTCWTSATTATVGTAFLSSVDVALILSVPRCSRTTRAAARRSGSLAARDATPPAPARILVVDDSITSRTLEQSVLAAAGYDVVTAVDGADGCTR